MDFKSETIGNPDGHEAAKSQCGKFKGGMEEGQHVCLQQLAGQGKHVNCVIAQEARLMQAQRRLSGVECQKSCATLCNTAPTKGFL